MFANVRRWPYNRQRRRPWIIGSPQLDAEYRLSTPKRSGAYYLDVETPDRINSNIGTYTVTITVESSPSPAPTLESYAALVGELEGPVTITDVSKFPTSFGEAPQLAAMVAAGKADSAEERLPVKDSLMVIEAVEGIGEYGGIWRRGFTGPADKWNGYRCCSGPDHVLFWDYTGSELRPNVAKDWEFNADGTEITLFLCEGMRWSDWAPFTADDFMFWYEVLYQNGELVLNKTPWFAINGKQGVMTKINDYAIKIAFEDPYHFFTDVLAGSTSLGGHAYQGVNGMGMFAPKHYLEQFVPEFEFVGRTTANRLARDLGYDNWVDLFKVKTTGRSIQNFRS